MDLPPLRWKHALSNIDPETRTGNCHSCGPGTRLNRRGDSGWRCYPATKERAKAWKRASRAARRSVLLDACKICGNTERLMWDHDHSTEEFRGTLCTLCNTGLGMFRDNPELLRTAIRYLGRHGPPPVKPESAN
jgi:hypothetical protein